jgi:hypothetical protein
MFGYRKTFQFAIVLVLLAAGSVSLGQTLRSGPQVLTFFSEVDDTEQPYGLYLPKNFDPAKKYPLVIMLHGAGSNHRLALRRVFGKSNLPGETDVEATRYFPEWKVVDYIVASPYARGTMLGAFTLNLVGHPKFDANRSVEMIIDGKKVTAKATDTLSLSKRQGRWVAAKYAAPTNAKRPGAEGPISEVIASRHVMAWFTCSP